MRHPLPRRLVVASLALLASAGCAGTEPFAPEGAGLLTDSLVYHARTVEGQYELSVGFTFFNRTGSRVFIPSCRGVHPPDLEKHRNGEWVVVHSPLILLCLGPPTVVPTGGSLRGSYRLPAGVFPQAGGEPIEGTYRLVWQVFRTYPGEPGEPLPLESRVSNEFRIVGQAAAPQSRRATNRAPAP